MQILSDCLHDLVALGPGGIVVLAAAMFAAGLAGSATHCALMCGPFVLAQVAAGADRGCAGGRLERLSGAALLPYHLGRMLGYGMLGALAGGVSGLVAHVAGARALLAVPLVLTALALVRLAIGRGLPALLATPSAPFWLRTRLGSLLAAADARHGVLLGLLLSALPCGLLYAALAGAASAGSALGGALAMLAFVLGTIPALVGVGLLGRLFLRQAGPWLRPVASGILVLNALLLTGLAIRLAA